MVKKTINTLACALIAPLAFAQTSTTEQKTTNQRTTPTETASGTVTTTYEPGELIVVGSESAQDTFSLVLDKTVRYVNKAGKQIDRHLIKPGTRINVYYGGTGGTRVVNRVVVDKNWAKIIRKFKAPCSFTALFLFSPFLCAGGQHAILAVSACNTRASIRACVFAAGHAFWSYP